MPTFILGEEEGVLHQDLGDQTLGTICCVIVSYLTSLASVPSSLQFKYVDSFSEVPAMF